MKSGHTPARVTGSRLTAFAVLAFITNAGLAGAETYQRGGSTATVEQTGGAHDSETRITYFNDGQRIVTRDGSSTDITIQHNTGPSGSGGLIFPWWGPEGFGWRVMDGRFSDRYLAEPGPEADNSSEPSHTSEEFKRLMLDRMRGRDW